MSRRGVVAMSVLAAWAAGLALLLVRELNPSSAARLADVSLRIVPITTYYLVEDAGHHVGFASIAIDTVPRALQVTEYLVTESERGSRKTDQLMVQLSRGLSLKSFASTRTAGLDTVQLMGHVVDSTLMLSGTQKRGSTSMPVKLPVFAGVIGATVSVLLDAPRVGERSEIRTIDPATGQVATRSMRVAAESLFVVVDSAVADSSGRWFAVHRDTVRAWRLIADGAPAFDAWMDAQGLLVESRLDNGLVLRRTAFELAFENWRQADPERAVSARGDGSVVSGTWLASGAPRPTASFDSLRVKFGSMPPELSTRYGRAFRAGGQLTFTRMPDARLQARYTLPTSEKWQTVFSRELAPAASIESDDPVIARRAARLASSESNPLVIARMIVNWVNDSVRAEAGVPSTTAAVTAKRRSGDARDFALLTVALARAAGIPAHPVAGLLQHQGKFYLHTWTEVYIGRWVPVDAMLGQFPADASHLPFLPGSADLSPDLARVLTRLQLTVVGAVKVQ